MRRVLFALLLGCAAGCGNSGPQPPSYGGEDGAKIAALVDQMNDDGNTIPKLKAAFAAGTPIGKKEMKTFPQYRYEIKGNPNVSGDTATATVGVNRHSVSDGGREMQWTFVKEGADWKIKSAPLP
jgi:hypothetical protein